MNRETQKLKFSPFSCPWSRDFGQDGPVWKISIVLKTVRLFGSDSMVRAGCVLGSQCERQFTLETLPQAVAEVCPWWPCVLVLAGQG